jgi:hypothetical protein
MVRDCARALATAHTGHVRYLADEIDRLRAELVVAVGPLNAWIGEREREADTERAVSLWSGTVRRRAKEEIERKDALLLMTLAKISSHVSA